MKRSLTACTCSYQQEYPWGYQVFQWSNGPTPWITVANVSNIDHAGRIASGFPHVLIVCRGCGSERCREMPTPPTTSPGRIELEMFP